MMMKMKRKMKGMKNERLTRRNSERMRKRRSG